MAKTKQPYDIIPGFQSIAPSIWVRICFSISTQSEDDSTPCLIILMTWTGAHNRYISSYTSKYASMFPSSRMMVITTSAKDFIFRSSARKQKRLQQAVDYILSLRAELPLGRKGILLHLFSEGGTNKGCELASAYRAATDTRLPISAMYLDSTPGHPRYLRLCSALSKSFPPVFVLRHLAKVTAVIVLGLVWVLYHVFIGYENNPVSRSREQLHDRMLFDLTVPRCYLYSKNDALIAWQDVYEHAGESMERCGCVTEVIFADSGHVDHAKIEPKRYWDTVKSVWLHGQEEHEGQNTAATMSDLQLPEIAFQGKITTAANHILEETLTNGKISWGEERYSAFV
ncbi:hypothetical protein BU25DRAFT_228452 [Macroventuria anomochaeta]|uniref:Uncharacterized protein n=1 Tax=Macroventuria anomochaeta TaxID=301207 RepID=A0ACB6RJD8_9PLEO|nr:uncharacterized protein BU25DRAFT_228452 [Macroventuria anomochaeta]KAF2621853.1 hypothetical protein BU25DRAFT_228452 [Macroventuria anomochaeta]